MWYYALGESETGPISEAEMQALIANGTIGPTTQVWKEGMAEWGPARSVPGLIPSGGRSSAAPVPPMAASSSFDDANPYSQSADIGNPADFGGGPGRQYDTFTKVMLILDIVFCGLQSLSLVAGVIMLALVQAAPQAAQVTPGVLAFVNMGVGGLMILCGLIGDILLLRRNRSGLSFAWVAVVATVLNLGLGVIDAFIQLNNPQFAAQFQNGPPEAARVAMIAAIGTAACMGIVRLGILVCYGMALKRASAALPAT